MQNNTILYGLERKKKERKNLILIIALAFLINKKF